MNPVLMRLMARRKIVNDQIEKWPLRVIEATDTLEGRLNLLHDDGYKPILVIPPDATCCNSRVIVSLVPRPLTDEEAEEAIVEWGELEPFEEVTKVAEESPSLPIAHLDRLAIRKDTYARAKAQGEAMLIRLNDEDA